MDNRPQQLSGWFLGFKTLVLKRIKDLVVVYNYGSQKTSNNHTTIQKTAGSLPVSSRA
jgi:hypothetical protein